MTNNEQADNMAEQPLIAYFRVSTDRQGQSGLGLEAQQAAVGRYAIQTGGQVIAEYTEVESGKSHKNRPQLVAALDHCRKTKATLLIAKLDRLGRNVAFIASLMESGVEFVCCDNPHANRLMLHMLAAFAEHEREQISKRTKAALAAAKARGVKLGNPDLPKINAERTAQADAFALQMEPIVAQIKQAGHHTYRALTAELDRRQVPTARGGRWDVRTVYDLVKRIERLHA